MRVGLAVLLVTSTASAEPALQEYGASIPLRPANQLVETSCDVDVVFAGAIVDVEVHQHLQNHGPSAFGAISELDLPANASLIGFALRGSTTEVALGVPSAETAELVSASDVLGADPAIVQLAHTDSDRHRYRTIVQPIEPDHDVTLVTHWATTADIHDATLHAVLPGRPDAKPCRVRIRAQPGPGATVKQIVVDRTPVARGAEATLGATDAKLDVELAFATNEPVAWLQSQALGDGYTAQAITVIAPPLRATPANVPRALLLIDGSRSMELVGRHNVQKLVHAIGAKLPANTQIEAIVYDRTPVRVLGAWRAADATSLAAIEAAVAKHPAVNGSDAAAALALAHTVIGDGTRGQAMIIAITDGAFGGFDNDDALTHALGMKSDEVDLHAIVLDPHGMPSPDGGALHASVWTLGGTFVEISIDDLDDAMTALDSWLSPAWLELALGKDWQTVAEHVPDELRAGGGFVRFEVSRRSEPVVLHARRDARIAIPARVAPKAAVGQLALALTTDLDFVTAETEYPSDTETEAGHQRRERLVARHPSVDRDHELAVLSTTGRVAKSRHQMVAGGGPYTRMIAIEDPQFPPEIVPNVTIGLGGSALDRSIVQRMLVDQLQPKAFACYERALGRSATLAGTTTIELDIGRGEIVRATHTSLGDATFDTCLLDAAYALSPPLPTPGYNVDDRSIVKYPLTFSVREQHPFVVPGDADSTSPLDIDKIQGGVARPKLDVETRTPLGNLRPPKSP